MKNRQPCKSDKTHTMQDCPCWSRLTWTDLFMDWTASPSPYAIYGYKGFGRAFPEGDEFELRQDEFWEQKGE